MKLELISREKLEYIAKKVLRYSLQDAEKDYFLALTMRIISLSALGELPDATGRRNNRWLSCRA